MHSLCAANRTPSDRVEVNFLHFFLKMNTPLIFIIADREDRIPLQGLRITCTNIVHAYSSPTLIDSCEG